MGRRLTVEGAEYEVFDAWSSAGGLVLCYFLALGRAATDRSDRRAALEPGEQLAALDEARLIELLATGAPLTDTERRMTTPDGGCWLAQNIGPVWAEAAAAGLTGVLFTDLTGSDRRHRIAADSIASMSPDRLAGLWTESLRDAEAEP